MLGDPVNKAVDLFTGLPVVAENETEDLAIIGEAVAEGSGCRPRVDVGVGPMVRSAYSQCETYSAWTKIGANINRAIKSGAAKNI